MLKSTCFFQLPGFCLEFMSEAARESTSKGVSIIVYVLCYRTNFTRLLQLNCISYDQSSNSSLATCSIDRKFLHKNHFKINTSKEKQRLDELFMFRYEKTKAPGKCAVIGGIWPFGWRHGEWGLFLSCDMTRWVKAYSLLVDAFTTRICRLNH